MQRSLYQTADAGVSLSDQRMQETLYQPADAGVSLSDSGCRRHSIRQQSRKLSIRQRMQEILLSHSGCRRHSIRQRMQKSLYHRADAGVSQSENGCKRHSIRCSRCLIECLLHPLGDRETSVSAV